MVSEINNIGPSNQARALGTMLVRVQLPALLTHCIMWCSNSEIGF